MFMFMFMFGGPEEQDRRRRILLGEGGRRQKTQFKGTCWVQQLSRNFVLFIRLLASLMKPNVVFVRVGPRQTLRRPD